MPGTSYAKKIVEWRFLVEQARPLVIEAPHLAAEHAAFEALVKEIEDLHARATMSDTTRRQSNRLRREAEVKGAEMRDRLAGALVHQFGPRSEKLLDYGVNPRRKIRRAPKPEAKAPTPPAAAPAS